MLTTSDHITFLIFSRSSFIHYRLLKSNPLHKNNVKLENSKPLFISFLINLILTSAYVLATNHRDNILKFEISTIHLTMVTFSKKTRS